MVVGCRSNDLGYRPIVSRMCFVNLSTEVRFRVKNESTVIDTGFNYKHAMMLSGQV